jgi:hypothetical protein
MNHTTRRAGLFISKVCLLLLALPAIARADGAIGFLSSTTSTTVAGQPFSWMEPGRDWDGVMTQVVAAVTHAAPSTMQNIKIVTSRSGGNLVMVFTIDDSTRVKPGGTPLSIGDKIIIEIDPDNSGHLAGSIELNPGSINNIATDYRFEIVINSGALDATKIGYRLPIVIGGGNPNNWGARTNFSLATLTLLSGPQRYEVTVTIPLSLIGNPANDIGITFAVLNDLGSTASDGSFDVTGSEFPLSMGLDTLVNDLGLVDSEQASGSWLNPARWGVGYFAFTSQDVNFTLSPSYYWSNSIKLSKCDVSDWNAVPFSGAGTDQLTLGSNWYRYNPNAPCKMRIWFNTFKLGPGAVNRRFLILWGRPGTNPIGWIFVTLTPPVPLTLTDTKSFFDWNSVPAIDFTSHPCLRIYILPEVLDPAFDEDKIKLITTDMQLGEMESAYGLQPNVNAHSAQMNFTATQPGTSCPSGSPCACLEQDRKEIVGSAGAYVRLVPASFLADRGEYLGVGGEPVNQTQEDRNSIKITAEAFGVPARGLSRKPYNYLERLGGIGWNLNRRDLGDQKQVQLEINISNPLLLQRDFTGAKPVDIKSPRRSIFLVIKVKSGQGTPAPTIVSRPPNPTLDPGDTVKGVITIDPTGTTGPFDPRVTTDPTTAPPQFKRFGLSFHAGVSIPHGSFGQVFDPGPNLAGDLEFRITPDVSLEGIFGYHRFGIQGSGSDLNLYQLSANIKYYAPGTAVRPFFNFGGGVYNFDPGPTDGGINLGGGLMFPVNSNVALEGAYNFHNVFTSGSNTRFSTLQGGIRFRF